MTIKNVRFGFATNSSSSHSIVFVKNDMREIRPYPGDFEYGWDWFLLREKNSKLRYLATAFRNQFDPEDLAKVLGIRNITNDDGSYIDHQSSDMLTGWVYTIDDLINLRDFILSDDVAIRGGNDNGEPPVAFVTDLIPISLRDIFSKDTVVRSDGNARIYFNKDSGTKIRLTTDNSDYVKSSVPELVDLKITEWCDKDCAFCYQDSSKKGKHGNVKTIKNIIKNLASVGVFEIAFGGGEPTSHPKFVDILEYTNSLGIIPNTTTRNIEVFNNTEKGKKIIDLVGGIAVSVNSLTDVMAANDIIHRFAEKVAAENVPKEHGGSTGFFSTWKVFHKFSFQIVMGTISRDEFEAIVSYIAKRERPNVRRITLLGYKTTGRGSNVSPINYDWWLESVITKGTSFKEIDYRENVQKETSEPISSLKEYVKLRKEIGKRQGSTYCYISNNIEVGIDTVMAEEYKQSLEQAMIEKPLYDIVEGAFSCYIDGVNQLIAPSSYCQPDDFRPFDKNWVETYQSFGNQGENPKIFHVDTLLQNC